MTPNNGKATRPPDTTEGEGKFHAPFNKVLGELLQQQKKKQPRAVPCAAPVAKQDPPEPARDAGPDRASRTVREPASRSPVPGPAVQTDRNAARPTTEPASAAPEAGSKGTGAASKDGDAVARLMEAARSGDLVTLRELARPELVNSRDASGRHTTALHIVAGYNVLPAAEHLLAVGADVMARDKGGLTPLHNACSYGHVAMAELLLRHGADPNAADLWRYTPLHEAASKGRAAICQLLLRHGASTTARNCDDRTPAELAQGSDVVDVFRGEAAIIEYARTGNVAKLRRLVTADNVNCHDTTGRQSTALHVAAGYNHLEVVQLLIERGASINATDKGGLMPLHNAASYGHIDVALLLLAHGAQVDATDLWRYTPLHEAASKGRTQMCALLLQHGANPRLQTADGKTPIDLAQSPAVRELLLAAVPRDVPADALITSPPALRTTGPALDRRAEAAGEAATTAAPTTASTTAPAAAAAAGVTAVRSASPQVSQTASLETSGEDLEIGRFLADVGLPQYTAMFVRECITVDMLADMEHTHLMELGVTAYGHRHRLIKAAQQYMQKLQAGTLTSTVAAPVAPVAGGTLIQYPSDWTLPPNAPPLTLVQLAVDDPTRMQIEHHAQSTIRKHRGDAGGTFDTYRILNVTRIQNKRLWERYWMRRRDVADTNSDDPNEKLLFHGSPFVSSIIEKGFDERYSFIGGMFGAGIYFAEDSSKSNQYVYGMGGGTGCTLHHDKSCYTCERQMLLCLVTLGRPCVYTAAQRTPHAPPGHDSVVGEPTSGGLTYREYAIYRGEQAYPQYLIRYCIAKPLGKP